MTHFEHLVTTPVKEDSCVKCQAPTWTGWVSGILVKVDVEPLDLLGEIQARLTGHATYQIRKHDRSFKLFKRDQFNITPDDHSTKIVLQEHVCDVDKLIAKGHPNYFHLRYTIETTERPAF